jgi:peptidoglycan/LPS O-acetylase OafA/YrhL
MVLALGVLVAHAWPLGFARPSIGMSFSSGQSDLGTLSVQGFFVLSGFLVTASALRTSFTRFAWHRVLRTLPGLWVCLLVTALVIAPAVAWYENGDLAGFWGHDQGPLRYLTVNWFAAMEQYPISGLLAGTPYGSLVGGPSAFDGSLWSLHYEFACYAGLGALTLTAVLRRAPRFVLLLTGAGYLLVLRDLLTASSWSERPPPRGAIGPFPLVGTFTADWTLYLGFLFLLGVVARLYMHRLPMRGSLAAVAAVAFLGTLHWGAFTAIGLPAFAYLLLYLAVALPAAFRRIGRGRDYSYGIYIYAFPVQQVLALIGGARYGVLCYILLSVAGTLLLAVPSWHLVERPALRLKDRVAARPPTARPPVARHRADDRSGAARADGPALLPAGGVASPLPVAAASLALPAATAPLALSDGGVTRALPAGGVTPALPAADTRLALPAGGRPRATGPTAPH